MYLIQFPNFMMWAIKYEKHLFVIEKKGQNMWTLLLSTA